MSNYYSDQSFLPGNCSNNVRKNTPNLVVNSLGYRTLDFDKINWKQSIVIFGCSNVFGMGLNEDETVSYQLNNILGLPVINMGVPGSSMMYSLINQIYLAENFIEPYAVVNLWTCVTRQTYFLADKEVHLGQWLSDPAREGIDPLDLRKFRQLYGLWNFDSSNAELHSITLKRIADLLWRNTIHIQGSHFENTAKVLNVDLFKIIDRGLDSAHPGPNTAKQTAEKIAEQIVKV